MRDDGDERAGRRRLAAELLLGYLHAAGSPDWPGADGLTSEEVLLAYPRPPRLGECPACHSCWPVTRVLPRS